ncbi:MAG: SigE family RNA polymerase sigma factor [Actinobacteria bacterium]|nr:SigE family RNA polymerase sigma factor [Actinomycetota bacterium]
MNHDEDFSDYASARWAALVRSSVILGCSPEEAKDLAQTALLRCYANWRKVRRAENLDAYVYKVLLNCHRDSRRRHWWRERPTDVLPDRGTADPTVDVDASDAVQRAVAGLSEVNRQVVVLRYFAHLTEEQTAAILGIPSGTVKSRMSRALKQLATSAHLSDHAEGHKR